MGATKRLDYAAPMKGSADAVVAAFAGHLGVTLSSSFVPDGGSPRHGVDDDDYAVLHGGLIKLRFDRYRQPLSLHYSAPAGCLGTRQQGGAPIAPAAANASVLSLLRRMGLAVDDTVAVESQLHQESRIWIGVYVRQTYRGEPIDLPSVFVVVDGITSRICEMRVPRWYAGLTELGPPLSDEALKLQAQLAGTRLWGGRSLGEPTLHALRIVEDTLCREVRFAAASELSLCLDVVTGGPVEPS